MKKIIRTLKSESAFTLIEMMIVLVIISILLLIVLPNVFDKNSVSMVIKELHVK
ncbi:prepilin-type N-terminal cleavage/methylation domain-containing protein [Salipaludibacillus sp. CF4.18]|uniref:prepilin-type N-terminal cleavage/methylation domain-containing protein n=1 Tax=Salipaludibacillus sp. CF4.18 TaxID=3373081 RepID=UPI003EE6ECFB